MSLLTTTARFLPGLAATTPGRNQSPRSSLFPRCANPACATGWLRLWRSHRTPIFEGRWACSGECTGELVRAAVEREMSGRSSGIQPHRVPIGLLLVEQGRISPRQLRNALDQQRRTEERTGERILLGRWLVENGIVDEGDLTRILSAQWNCPVFSIAGCRPEEIVSALPRFLAETMGTVPVRMVRGRLLYLACSQRVDRSLAYGVERMSRLRVVPGVVRDSEFRTAQARYLAAQPPPTRILEVASTAILARALTRLIESEKPAEARLVRIHETWWLRIWRQGGSRSALPAATEVEDTLARVGVDFNHATINPVIGTGELVGTADKAGRESPHVRYHSADRG